MNQDIVAPNMKDNETWNDCPDCGNSWKDVIPTPGLIHRTKRCARCTMKMEHKNGPKRNHLH
jgi:nitrous oxide reductase accessory protein NosL